MTKLGRPIFRRLFWQTRLFQERDFFLFVAAAVSAGASTAHAEDTFYFGTIGVFAADVNFDGNADIISLVSTGLMTVYLGDGLGNFQFGSVLPIGPSVGDAVMADMNGDSVPDVMISGDGSTPPQLFVADTAQVED